MKLLHLAVLLLLSSASGSAFADLYRWVDENGKVTFSDRPPPDINTEAEQLKEPKLPPPREKPGNKADADAEGKNTGEGEKEEEKPTVYTALSITSPGNKRTVRSNTGRVPVSVSISPALDTKKGDRIRILLDGRRRATIRSTSTTLKGITPGKHRISALVVDSNGVSKRRSGTRIFYLLRN